MNEKPIKKHRRRRRIVRRIVTLVIVLALLAGIGWYGYGMLKQEYTVTYDGYTATIGSISNSLSFSGSLQLIDSASYMASANTTVRKVYVEAGQDVAEGENLLRLSNGETIRAEFDGRVNSLSVNEGDEVANGDALVQVADFTHLKVSFRVDEYDISDVAVGQACTVTATATERTFQSEIASIDYISSAGGSVAYYTAVAYVDVDEGIYPGMQATVTIPQEEAENVVILKMDALSFDETNSAYVYMYNDAGELEEVPVEVGVSNGNYVEIVSGLSEGDEVYVEAKVEATASGLSGLLSGLFGGQQMNAPQAGGSHGGGSGGNSPEGAAEQGFRVTPGEALTSSHASGSGDMHIYGTVALETSDDEMTTLTLGEDQLKLTLDGGAAFTASLDGSTLRLEPVAAGMCWEINLSALQTLKRSGIETLFLAIEDGEIELPTGLELGGSIYGMLRAQGLVAKDFTLEISAKEWAVCVGGNRYLLTDGELATK